MNDKFKFPDEIDEKDGIEVQAEDDIEIVDDTPPVDRGRKPLDRDVNDPTDDELAAYSEGVKKRMNELTHARHDERRAKEALLREKQELERVAQVVLEENRRLKQAVNTGTEQYVETAKTAAEASLDVAKRRFKEAFETGDADQIMDAQAALTTAQMRAETAKNFRHTPLQVDEDVVQQRQPVAQAPELDEKTLSWQARNQWFGDKRHKAMTSFALGVHQELVDDGVDTRSDAYYEKLDSRVRSTFRDFFADTDKSGASQRRNPPPTVVAPAARSTGTRKVQLTQTQVQLAARLGLTPKQYAAELVKLEKQNG
jgi:hypothetical protein